MGSEKRNLRRCARAELSLRGLRGKAGGAPAQAMPIDLFMLYLINNIHLTPGTLESAGRSLTGTAGP